MPRFAIKFGKGHKALHGDIAQNNREVVLQGFRDNKFQVLVHGRCGERFDISESS